MSVILWKEKQSQGRHTYRGTVVDKQFIAQTDSSTDDASVILNYQDAPRPKQAHPTLSGTWVESVNATPIDNKTWDVSVKYTHVPIPRFTVQRGSFAGQTAVLGFDSTQIQEEMAVDLDGNSVVNTADIPIAGVTRTVHVWKLVVQRYEPTFSPDFAVDMSDSVNETAFVGAAPFQVLLGGIKATPVSKGPQAERLWDVRYPFSFKFTEFGWEEPVISIGTHAWTVDPETNQAVLGPVTATIRTPDGVPIMRDDGTPEVATVTEPVLLDEDGFVASVGADPVKLFFRRHKLRSFQALNLESAINAEFS